AQAHALYERERDRSRTQAKELAGMPPQALPYAAGDPSGDAAARHAYDSARANFLALVLCLMMGTAALPHILARSYTTPSVVAAGGLAAALSTADGLLLTISNALAHDVYYQVINPRASAIRRVMLSKVLVLVVALAAAVVASLKIADILQFVSAAFSLASSAFFPALTLGIFWRRATRAGATLGMLAGLGT